MTWSFLCIDIEISCGGVVLDFCVVHVRDGVNVDPESLTDSDKVSSQRIQNTGGKCKLQGEHKRCQLTIFQG